MTEEEQELVDKAERTLAAANVLLRQSFPEFAVSGAYYAMFHSASAALTRKGLDFKSHSGTHSGFALQFTQPGLLPLDLHRWLTAAADDRIAADYTTGHGLSEADAAAHIEHAELFLQAVREFLSKPD